MKIPSEGLLLLRLYVSPLASDVRYSLFLVSDHVNYLCAGHPWLRKHVKVRVPLDTLVFRLMKAYMQSSQMRKAALRVCT